MEAESEPSNSASEVCNGHLQVCAISQTNHGVVHGELQRLDVGRWIVPGPVTKSSVSATDLAIPVTTRLAMHSVSVPVPSQVASASNVMRDFGVEIALAYCMTVAMIVVANLLSEVGEASVSRASDSQSPMESISDQSSIFQDQGSLQNCRYYIPTAITKISKGWLGPHRMVATPADVGWGLQSPQERRRPKEPDPEPPDLDDTKGGKATDEGDLPRDDIKMTCSGQLSLCWPGSALTP